MHKIPRYFANTEFVVSIVSATGPVSQQIIVLVVLRGRKCKFHYAENDAPFVSHPRTSVSNCTWLDIRPGSSFYPDLLQLLVVLSIVRGCMLTNYQRLGLTRSQNFVISSLPGKFLISISIWKVSISIFQQPRHSWRLSEIFQTVTDSVSRVRLKILDFNFIDLGARDVRVKFSKQSVQKSWIGYRSICIRGIRRPREQYNSNERTFNTKRTKNGERYLERSRWKLFICLDVPRVPGL